MPQLLSSFSEFKFHPIGIGANNEGKLRTLHNITSELGHSRIDVLKMDIESAEYSVIPDIFSDPNRPRIDQILIEVHFSWPLKLSNLTGQTTSPCARYNR